MAGCLIAASIVAAIVPPANQPYQYQLQVHNNDYLVSATGPMTEFAAGTKVQFHEELFVGRNCSSSWRRSAANLERTVDFGILTSVAQPLFTGSTM